MAKKKPSKRKARRAKPAPGHDDRLVVDSYKKLAEIFGVQLSTIETWRTAGMPVKAKGQYVVEDIRNWVTINGKGRKSSSEKDLGELTDEAVRAAAREKIAKAEKLEQEAEILGRKNRMEQGGLCRRIDVDRFITSFLSEARILWERLVVECAAGYGPELQDDLREDLGNRKDLLLNQLGDYIERLENLEIVKE